MKVLVVLAFNKRHQTRGATPHEPLSERFVRLVKIALKESTQIDQLDLITRRSSELGEFLPPVPASGVPPDMVTVRRRLATLDGIDLVFIDGHDNLLPWSPDAAPILQLLQLCAVSNKPVLGCGCAVQLLSYLVSVGSTPVRLANSGASGPSLASFAGSATAPTTPAASAGALLEKHTGDLFVYDASCRAWEAVRNIGVHFALGASHHQAARGDGLNRSMGMGLCEVSTLAKFHFLFKGMWPPTFPVSQTNEWRCHLRPGSLLRLPTGDQEVRVLASSQLGHQVLECGNIVALQFRPDPRLRSTLALLQNFVDEKTTLVFAGEGARKGAEPPRRILADASSIPGRSDLLQMVLHSLAPPPALTTQSAASSSSILHASAVRQAVRLHGSASATSRPGSSPADRNTAPARQASMLASGRGEALGGYHLHPNIALSYLSASRGVLARAAEEVHVGATTKAFAEMQGQLRHVPIYVAKPPRQSSASRSRNSDANSVALSRMQPVGGSSAEGPGQSAKLVDEDLVVEGFDIDEDGAMPSTPVVPTKPRVVRVKVASAKPFSNYHKHLAARKAVEGQPSHVTSAGPYLSDLDRVALDEREMARKSIHPCAFKPGGLRKFSPADSAGFAAGGFNVPADMPQSAHRFGFYHNALMHSFRPTTAKQNLYM
jgi:hypothetical protein